MADIKHGNWRACENFPEWEVSDVGFVRRRSDGYMLSPRILNQSNDRQYRVMSKPRKAGERTRGSVPISHLVLATFRQQKPSNNHVALHLDGDTLNDCIDNLEWTTRSDSSIRSTDAKYGTDKSSRVRSRGGQSAISDRTARAICKALARDDSTYEQIASRYSVSKTFVASIANGHRRRRIAIEEGLLRDNPAIICEAWPYLSTTDRMTMLRLANKVYDKNIREPHR